MIRRVRICIWRGGFFSLFLGSWFWVLGAVFFMLFLVSFFLLLSLCRFLCCSLWAVFFVLPFYLRCCLWTVFFRLFSSSRFSSSTSCFSLCFVFIEPFSSRLCLFLPGVLAPLTFFFCLITFSFLSSWVFCGPFSWCFFLSFVLFVLFSLVHFLCVVFFVPFALSRFIVRFILLLFFPSLSLPSRSSRLANVILRFRLPLSIDEPVCLPP